MKFYPVAIISSPRMISRGYLSLSAPAQAPAIVLRVIAVIRGTTGRQGSTCLMTRAGLPTATE